MRQVIVLLVLLVAVFSVVSAAKCRCGVNRYTTRIVDGRPSKKAAHPWLVKLKAFHVYDDEVEAEQCGATFINNQWLLTAAHCIKENFVVIEPKETVSYITYGRNEVADFDDSLFFHENGTEKLQALNQLTNYRKIDKMVLHPGYKRGSYAHDIALLRLSEPVQFGETVGPICLPEKDLAPYRNLNVAGWGRTGDWTEASDILMEVDIQESDRCPKLNRSIQICAKTGLKGTCQGDSGGPLMTIKQGRVHQVGVVSHGAASCNDIEPDVYTKVSAYLPWIKATVDSGEWCD